MHLGTGNMAKAGDLLSRNDQEAAASKVEYENSLPEDGRRYSGFRFFAGLISAIAASVAIWTAVIYMYHLVIGA